MNTNNVRFTAEDDALMESMKGVALGLSKYLGSAYEIVLHTLKDLNHSAVLIINGEHSGREEGAPITDLALTMLSRINSGQEGDCITYNTSTSDGKKFHSTTIAVRGKGGKVIGLLCINLNMDTSLSAFIGELFGAQPEPSIVETYKQNAEDMVRDAVRKTIEEVDGSGLSGKMMRNREIVSRLYAAGVFSVKEAVPIVAECLDISKNTVYLHLRHCRN